MVVTDSLEKITHGKLGCIHYKVHVEENWWLIHSQHIEASPATEDVRKIIM